MTRCRYSISALLSPKAGEVINQGHSFMRRYNRKAQVTILVLAMVSMSFSLAARAQDERRFSAGDPPAARASATTTAERLPASDYIIGADDVLAINVWKEPDFSRSLPVRPDGKISLPLVGDLTAGGLTPVQLQSHIRQQLLNYLSHPEVAVIVQEARSKKFNIVGEVQRPGSYTFSKPMTALDAIAAAGGFRDFAKTTKIYVLRVNGDGSHTRIPFNYRKVIQGRKSYPNPELEPRDTVVVP